MFIGLRTALYYAPDIQRAKAWYREVLGIEPYVDERFYVGFKVGDTELGLDPNGEGTPGGNAGVVSFWSVTDVAAEVERLVRLGATRRSEMQEMDGVCIATVLDPFGNIPGPIRYPDAANNFSESTVQEN